MASEILIKEHKIQRFQISDFGSLHGLTFVFPNEVWAPPQNSYQDLPCYSFWLPQHVQISKIEFGFSWRGGNWAKRVPVSIRIFRRDTGNIVEEVKGSLKENEIDAIELESVEKIISAKVEVASYLPVSI